MGKFNEIQEQTTQSWGGNSFTTTIKNDTVEFDSAKDKFTFTDPVEVPSINVGGTQSVPFSAEDKTKLDNLQTPMQIKGRVDSVGDLPTEGVQVGDVYLVGVSGSENFEEYVCTEISGSPAEPVWESVGSTQVQADWNQTNTSAVDYIKNKPTIPSAQIQADWNQNDDAQQDYIKNRPFYQIGEASLIGEVVASTSMVQFKFSTALVNGKTYTVSIDDTEYSITSAIDNNMVSLATIAGNIFYDPQHNVAQRPNNAFIAGPANGQTVKIYNYVEIVKLNSKFLDGSLIKDGTGIGANIFNNSYNNNTASGRDSSAFGNGTTSSGERSASFGSNTTASGDYSHAEGAGTTAARRSQHVFGEYNVSESGSATTKGTYVEIVGNGTGAGAKSNARTLDWAGNEMLAGTLTIGGASGATIKVDSGALKVSFDGGTTWKTISAS